MERLAKQLFDLTNQHASNEAVWEKKVERERSEKREDYSLKFSRTTVLQSQFFALKREGEKIRVVTKQRDNLVAVREQQRQTIGNMWGRIERLKNGLCALENSSPPFPQLHHNYERQRHYVHSP